MIQCVCETWTVSSVRCVLQEFVGGCRRRAAPILTEKWCQSSSSCHMERIFNSKYKHVTSRFRSDLICLNRKNHFCLWFIFIPLSQKNVTSQQHCCPFVFMKGFWSVFIISCFVLSFQSLRILIGSPATIYCSGLLTSGNLSSVLSKLLIGC